MLTRMTDDEWAIVLKVAKLCRSQSSLSRFAETWSLIRSPGA